MTREHNAAVVLLGQTLEWCVLKERRQVADVGKVDWPAAEAAPEAWAALRKSLAAVRSPVTIGLASDQVLLRVVSLPAQDPQELAGMVQLQVDKFSPFPLETLVVSHEVLQAGADASTVLIGAAKEEVVDALGKTLASAGLAPRRVDVAVLGWWRLLKDAGAVKEKGRQILLLLHEGAGDLIVAQNGYPVLMRTLPAGDAAEELVQELGFALMSLDMEYGSQGAAPIAVWHRAKEPHALLALLRQTFSAEVEAKTIASLPTLAEGLARRAADGRSLDLSPASWRAAAAGARHRRRMLAVAAAGAGVWLLSVGVLLGGLQIEKLRLARLQSELQTLQEPAMAVRETRRRVEMVRRYTHQQDSALECLREICARQTPGIQLTSFTYKKDGGVKLSGTAGNVEQVYNFKKGLDEAPLFSSLKLQGPQERGGKQVFDVDMKLTGGGAKEP